MELYTVIGLVSLVLLAVIGIPIYMAILSCSIIILVIGLGVDPIVPMTVMFGRLSNISLIAIPLFVILGQILAYGGSGKSLIRMLNAFMGHLPGGPAYALVLASVIVAAMCSSPVAAIAAFGPLIIPILVALGYSDLFAVGLLICSSTLAPLIPPNTTGILYSYIAQPLTSTDVSVKILWTASIIPGILIAVLLCISIFIYSRMGHFKQLPSVSWAERWIALKEGWPVAITPVAVLLPLYTGIATPTQVSAIGVVYIIFISIFFYHGLTPKAFWTSCTSTLRILGSILLILVAALLLNIAITYANVPQDITTWITDMGLNWWVFILAMVVIFTLIGMFLDPTAILLVCVPMLMATVNSLGINAVAFGVFTIIAVNLAGVTPPYGLTIFASQSVLNKSYSFVCRACIMFVPAVMIGLVLIGLIAPLTTWLPTVIR